MRLARVTSRFGDLTDLYTFECRACGVSHIEAAALFAAPTADRDPSDFPGDFGLETNHATGSPRFYA